MSEAKYTDETMVKLGDVKEAYHRAMDVRGGCWSDVLAELERPEIAPDVPVLVDYRSPHGVYTGTKLCWYKNHKEYEFNIRVLVLIPENTVRDWVEDIISSHVPAANGCAKKAYEHIEDCIAAYKREGK